VAEPTQFSFDLKEVTAVLIKAQGVHEGTWSVALEFVFTAGVFGVAPTESKPGALFQVNKFQLVRHPEGSEAPPFAVDAGKVNPAPAESKTTRA
jgi:hypothetical protein